MPINNQWHPNSGLLKPLEYGKKALPRVNTKFRISIYTCTPAPLSLAKQTCNLWWMSMKPRHRFLLKLLGVWCHNQHLYMRARARNKTRLCMFCYLLCFYASRHHNVLVSSLAQSEKKNVEISGRKKCGIPRVNNFVYFRLAPVGGRENGCQWQSYFPGKQWV